MPVTQAPVVRPALWPARIFGENPLLAYILVFLAAPLIDASWFGTPEAPVYAARRRPGMVQQFVEPRAASLAVRRSAASALIFVVCWSAIASAGSSSSDPWN